MQERERLSRLSASNSQLRIENRVQGIQIRTLSDTIEQLNTRNSEYQLKFNRIRQGELSDIDTVKQPSIMERYSTLREDQIQAAISIGGITETAGWTGAAFLWLLAIGAIIGRID